ncbi:abc transporter transmembrane region domain-containing protein, partial [Cystoisospora suis]
MSFFDKQENNVGYLTGVLSSDVISMKTGSAGNAIALVQSFAAIVAGLVIAFIGDARLAAVILACLVIVIPASAAQAQISQPGARKSKGDSSGGDEKGNLLQQAEKKESVSFVMSEALNGIRIVTAYSLEPYFTQRFSQVLHKTLLADERAAFFLGFCWGFSQGAQYAVNALAFWYGGELIKNEGKDPTQIMQAIFALTFSGSSIGQTVLFSSDAGKAEKAAERVYYLIDRPSKIDSRDPGGKSLDPRTFRGHIEVERINFVYPSRPHIPV